MNKTGRTLARGGSFLRIRLAMAAMVLVAAGAAAAQAQPETRNQSAVWRVVLMRSSDSLYPVNFAPDKALRAALREDAPRLIDFYNEEIDPLRFPGAVEADVVSLLQRKYHHTPVDLVVASGMESLEFAARHRDTIWPGAPIVFNGVLEGVPWRRPPRTTGVTVALDIEGTVALGRSLAPNLRRLHVVSGSAEIERTLLTLAMQKLARLDPPLEVHYLVGLTRGQVSERVAMLEPGDMVLYLTMLRDPDGQASDLTAPAMLQIAASASVPVLSVIHTQYGRGVLGGSSPRYEAHARAAGELARKVLQGADPDTLEVRSLPPPTCEIDWHGLTRWQLPVANVPQGCTVLNRPADPLQAYSGVVAAAVAVMVAQALLLAALLLNSRRRRRAETELRAHTAALAHESRMSMIGALTADLAHQINQPMGAILSNTEAAQLMLEQGTLTPDKLREILVDIRDDDIRASEVIRTLRALVARTQWRPTALEPNTEVAEALRLVALEAARQKVTIRPSYGADMPAVLGDPVQLQQVVINLVVNSIEALGQFTGLRREVHVETSAQGHGVAIAVADAGPGVSAEEAKRLFEPGFSAKRATMGFGLAIVRSIVETHRGRVWFEPNVPQGAVFRVWLPAIGT